MPKVFILSDTIGSSYHSMFLSYKWEIAETVDEADLVCFTGGTDVDPAYYDQGFHPRTGGPDILRDRQEKDMFIYCDSSDIPMVGICRGAQFLCVGNNGKLIQHVTNHTQRHMILTSQGEYQVTSSHHQMMYPFNVQHEMIGWASERSETYEQASQDDKAVIIDKEEMRKDGRGNIIEPEIVYFEDTRSLCHQPHPEWTIGSSYCDFFFKTIEQYLGLAAEGTTKKGAK